jgi:hypothetical protein
MNLVVQYDSRLDSLLRGAEMTPFGARIPFGAEMILYERHSTRASGGWRPYHVRYDQTGA